MEILSSPVPENNKELLLNIEQHNPRLELFNSKLEGYFSKFEFQTKYRAALHVKKQELLNELTELRKEFQEKGKYKKLKDKDQKVELIDRLKEAFDNEQKTRALAETNKDRIVKDLTNLNVKKMK